MRYFPFIPLLFLGFSPSQASVITLESQVKNTVRQDAVDVMVTVTNRGDETAHNIQITVKSPLSSKQSDVFSALPVGEKHSESSTHSLRGLHPGLYPLIVQIGYTDANLYPFSAMAISPLIYKTGSVSSILGRLGNVKVRQNGRLNLKVKNLEGQNKQVAIQLLAPREISVENSPVKIDLPAGAESQISFPVHNFSALQNSTYAVYATMEYEENGTHYTALAPGTLFIAPPNLLSSIQSYLGPVFILLLAFGLLIGGRIYWELKKGTAKPSSPGIRR